MRDYITVRISPDSLLDMLSERLNHWRKTSKFDSPKEHELYMEMYQRWIDDGCFDDADLNIDSIVDNDVVNWTTIYYKGDKDFELVMKTFDSGDCEVFGIGTIESVDNPDNPTMILVRH